jgi:hypothetical protein
MSLEATLERVSAIRQALADPAALIGAGTGVSGGTQAPSTTDATPAGTTPAGLTGAAPASESSFAAALEQASGGAESASGDTAPAYSPYGSVPAGSSYGAQGLGGVAGVSAEGVGGLTGVAGLSPAGLSGEGSTGSRIVAIAESQLGQTEQPPGSNESPAIAMYRGATAGAIPGEPWCAYFASWVTRQAGAPIGEGGQGAGAVSAVWSWAQSAGRAIPNGPGVVPKPGDLIVFGDEHVGIVRDVLPNGQIQTIEGNYENKVAANVRSPTEATGYVEMS